MERQQFTKKVKSNPMIAKQKELMVEFISSRREMCIGKITSTYTRDMMRARWAELSNILNSIPEGPAKEWQQWRKTWVDLKKNTKSKLCEDKKYRIRTDCGLLLQPSDKPSIEDKIAAIITTTSVSGDDNSTREDEMPASEADVHEADTPQEVADHDYTSCLSKLAESGNKKQVTFKRKRKTKTTRLTQLINNREKKLKRNEENFRSLRIYRKQKLVLLRNEINLKKNYYKQKLLLLNQIADAVTHVADNLIVVDKND